MATVGTQIGNLRAEFPALHQTVNGRPLAYLDTAASAQRPLQVIEAVSEYEKTTHANVHRGVHSLSQRATDLFEEARALIAAFLNAESEREIVFTKGCTEAINLVAHSWGRQNLQEGDRILLSTMEHHANIVPWQIVAAETGATVEPIPITDDGDIDLLAYQDMLDRRVKFVGCVHVSNAIGTINPVEKIVAMAKEIGATTLVDGAQGCPHGLADVREIGADFYTVSGHKMYAPTGVGCLYGRYEILKSMSPYQTGGNMIRTVSFSGSTFADPPDRFEPGTPNISGFIGLGAAVRFLNQVGFESIVRHERGLTNLVISMLADIEGVSIIGKPAHRSSTISFTMNGVHPHDIGTVLDSEGVAIRAGHHCCMPLMERLGLPATARASFGLYSNLEDVEALIRGVKKVREVFA
ncbi:MAG TPA: SufS family cysteine desulfurase [Fimbriimonadaceae bacterium]|nr:SufS family cysteine desulfurase [Fimbriimonadaceae bacterium]